MPNQPATARDPRKDPKIGDVFRDEHGFVLAVDGRRSRRPNEYVYGCGNAKEIVWYRIKQHPGLVCSQATSGFIKRLKKATVLHAAH